MATASDLTKQGIAIYKAKDKVSATALFRQATQVDPNYEMAWLWLSAVVESDTERKTCLERALTINPQSEPAKNGLAKLISPATQIMQPTLSHVTSNAISLHPEATLVSTPASIVHSTVSMANEPASIPASASSSMTLSHSTKARGTMRSQGKLLLFSMFALILVVAGVGYWLLPGFKDNKLTVPEIFKTQLMRFLEEGSKVDAMTAQGVNYRDFKQQVANAQATYNLINSTWPSSLPLESHDEFQKALEGWSLTIKLWELNIDDLDNPVEPDINSYKLFVSYGGDALVLETHPNEFLVPSFRGKKFLPFEENISVLMTISGSHFDRGKEKILQVLQQN